MIEITTNGQVREGKYYPCFTPAQNRKIERAYGGLISLEDGEFVFYRGEPYFMGECMRINHIGAEPELKGWDGYFGETFFSMVVVKTLEDGYIFGHACS